jgi:hypothetical protein
MMFDPPVLQKSLCNSTNIVRDIMKEHVITRYRQLFKLQQMPTLHPRKHLDDTNQSETNDILIALRKGDG